MLLLAAFFAVAIAQDPLSCDDLDTIEEAQKFCGEQTQHAAKCLTPCFQEAQACFKKVGTKILDIQTCMLELGDENRSQYCNSCINQQIDAQCDVLFACIREREAAEGGGKGDEVLKFEEFVGFKRYCQAQAQKSSCVESGCHFNKRGCTAKYSKVNCNRIQLGNICTAIPGCKVRKMGANKRGQICKGSTQWDEPVKKEKKDKEGGR